MIKREPKHLWMLLGKGIFFLLCAWPTYLQIILGKRSIFSRLHMEFKGCPFLTSTLTGELNYTVIIIYLDSPKKKEKTSTAGKSIAIFNLPHFENSFQGLGRFRRLYTVGSWHNKQWVKAGIESSTAGPFNDFTLFPSASWAWTFLQRHETLEVILEVWAQVSIRLHPKCWA